MKRIYKYFGAILLLGSTLVGCRFPEEPKPIPNEVFDGVKVQVLETKDNSVNFSVTPIQGVLFYTVSIFPESENMNLNTKLNAEDVFRNRVNNAVYYKLYSAKDMPEVKSSAVEGLAPYTKYIIVALANNVNGFISNIAKQEFVTTDEVAPAYSGNATVKGDMVTFVFSELIKKVGNSGQIVVKKFSPFDLTTPIASYNLSAESVSVDGTNLVLKSKEFECPGAIYLFSLPKGVISDLKGNVNEEITSSISEDGNAEGLVVQVSNVEWEFDAVSESFNDVVSSATATLNPKLSEEAAKMLVKAYTEKTPKPVATVTYSYDNGSSESFSSNDLCTVKDSKLVFNFDKSKLNEHLTSLTVTVPEGTLYDYYSNVNKEFSFTLSK